MLTKTVDIRDARVRFDELLSAVASGTEIVLMHGNVPVARLVPALAQAKPVLPALDLSSIRAREDVDEPAPDDFWLGKTY
jgi:antitoxin (DNA-binding transcriptional repressor) of toxin-antitoxin stability system